MNILIVGACGRIGKGLCEKFLQEGWSVWGIDFGNRPIEHKNFDYTMLSKNLHPTDSGENEISEVCSRIGPRFFDLVIFAVRFRESNVEVQDADISRTSNILKKHFETTVLSPLFFIEHLSSNFSINNNSVIVFLGSTNGLEISQQSMGYGTSNAALVRMYKEISIQSKVAMYLILLGVLLPLNQRDMLQRQTFDELCELVNFLNEKKPRSMIGEPIFLASGRFSLDATAVKMGVFDSLFL